MICTSRTVEISTAKRNAQDVLLLLNHEILKSDTLVFCRDGIPPYKLGTKKQLQREMHRSVRINGQITLPHFPVSPTSSSYTSCLCVSFFCNLLNSNFYTLKDNWVLIPLRSCASFYFYPSPFFPPQSSCCVRIQYSVPPLIFILKSG